MEDSKFGRAWKKFGSVDSGTIAVVLVHEYGALVGSRESGTSQEAEILCFMTSTQDP